MRTKKLVLLAALTTGATFGSFALAPSAEAVCTAPGIGTDCGSFNPSSPSIATQTYTSANLTGSDRFQLLFQTTGGTYTVSGISWSQDNTNFNNFATNSLSVGSTIATATTIVTLGSFINSPFYVRYTIPTGVTVGDTISSELLINNSSVANGISGGILVSQSGNSFAALERTATAVPLESDALPIVGAAAFMAGGLWFKRRRAQAKANLDFLGVESDK